MLKQIKTKIYFPKKDKKYINSLKPFSGEKWSLKNKKYNYLEIIKKYIRFQLFKLQNNKCAYCGLELEETSPAEIEHIAPKDTKKHPEFMFMRNNLVLACHFCNGFSKKGNLDTILKKEKNYKKCTFNIVHPYFDNPEEYFEWVDERIKVLIKIKNNSDKAKNSIEIFELDSTKQSESRAKQIRFLELKEKFALEQSKEKLIKDTLVFK